MSKGDSGMHMGARNAGVWTKNGLIINESDWAERKPVYRVVLLFSEV